MAEQKINEHQLKEFNKALKKRHLKDDIFEKKVLFEKCRNGRFVSPLFEKRIEAFYKGDLHTIFDRQESLMEGDLIALLQNFKIYAMLKTNKRSLLYTNEIVVKLPVESDMNVMWDYRNTYRKIVAELLGKNIYKIRFYVHVETYEDLQNIFFNCGIKYCFRYFKH